MGGEYETNFLKSLCEKSGIIHEVTASYTLQQNDIAKRKNRTLREIINAMLISFSALDSLWGKVVLTTNHILNRIPHI